ncbi:MAG: GNAT family N-acetyltransferase [Anaerolineae bacterium]|nr:GNAT family N-acetyltransferase [Anaerolineae bacterium]
MNRTDAINVRPMTMADIPALARFLAQDPLWRRYNVSEKKARLALEAASCDGEELYIAVVDGQPAGLIWFLHQGTFGRSGYIRLIGVLPQFRGRGVGTRLMATAEVIIGRKAGSVFLLTSDFNEGAQAFYRRLGYR